MRLLDDIRVRQRHHARIRPALETLKQDGCVLETGWPQVKTFIQCMCYFLVLLFPFSSLSIMSIPEARFVIAYPRITLFYGLNSPDSNTAKLKLPDRAPSMLSQQLTAVVLAHRTA